MGNFFDNTHSYRAVMLVFAGAVIVAAGLFASLPKYRVSD
jgi:hypothetical protein